jgi:hypothetical protein
MTEIEDMEDKLERAGLKKNKGKMFAELSAGNADR